MGTEGAKELKEKAYKNYESERADHESHSSENKNFIERTTDYVKDTLDSATDFIGATEHHTDEDKGFIESTTDYVSESVNSVTGFFGAKTEEAKHKANEERHSAQRKAKKEQVKNDDADISDRLSAAGDYVTEGAKELKEKAYKNYESERADNQ